MLKQFYQDLRLHGKTGLRMLLIQCAVFLAGAAMVCIIMTVDSDPGSWFCLGTLVAGIYLFISCVFFYSFSYAQELNLALSMGRLRKQFLGAYTLRLILHLALSYILLLGFHQVELTLYPRLFPAYGNEVYFAVLTDWRFVVPMLLGIPILGLFMGGIYSRYGKKGMVAFYVFWLFCCLILPRMIPDESHNDPTPLNLAANWTMNVILSVPGQIWAIFGAMAAAVMVTVTYRLTMTQVVK